MEKQISRKTERDYASWVAKLDELASGVPLNDKNLSEALRTTAADIEAKKGKPASVSTLNNLLSAVRHRARQQGEPDPVGALTKEVVRKQRILVEASDSVVSARLTQQRYERLTKAASSEGLTVAGLVRRLIYTYLDGVDIITAAVDDAVGSIEVAESQLKYARGYALQARERLERMTTGIDEQQANGKEIRT